MKIKHIIFSILGLAMILVACEDPNDTFNPKNPNLSEGAVKGTVNSAQKLLNGVERQLTLATNEVNKLAELAADNYVNTRTFFNQLVDKLTIDTKDDDIDDTQFAIHRMRELALTGLNDIGPADPNYSANQQAEFRFFVGYSNLLAGEVFKTLPLTISGPAATQTENLNAAVTQFSEGLKVATTDFTKASLLLARARAHYRLGNKQDAVTDATAAIALDPDFVRFAQFDQANATPAENTVNELQDALYDRGNFDDLQPLPRLDFLDPKYHGDNPTTDVNAPILKIEEAHLILAEAALADNNLAQAKTTLKNVVALVATRPKATFSDSGEGRTQSAPNSRPNKSDITVAASATDSQRAGLVINRQGSNVTVPLISGTSVTNAMIDAVTTVDAALELLYLMRQEIFIAEGRRMTDLGIRLVVSEVESLANPNIKTEDTQATIPPFLEPIKLELDAFTYDVAAKTVVIKHNLNRLLVQNKTSPFVLPFH